MSHTGIYIGGGSVIHASGHNTGVINSPMPRSWTHYAIPIGLYEEGEITMVDEYLIRRRDKGEKVKTLQQGLIRLGYDLGPLGADGDFGSKTEAAVRLFQSDKGLPVDAVWDSGCQAALSEALEATTPAQTELPLAALDHVIEILMTHRISLDQALEELMDARDLTA